MKKTYVKSAMEFHSCDPKKLKGDAAEREMEQQLKESEGLKQKKYRGSKNFILRKIAGETFEVDAKKRGKILKYH